MHCVAVVIHKLVEQLGGDHASSRICCRYGATINCSENKLKNIKLSVDVYMVILGETAVSRSFLIAQEIRTN